MSMKFDFDSYRKHTYIGKDNNFHTHGKEYNVVEEGECVWAYGYKGPVVFVSTNQYTGSDIDYCDYMSYELFNKVFEPKLYPKTTQRGDRLYKTYVKRKRKQNIMVNKIGKVHIERMLEEGTLKGLHLFEHSCSCYACRQDRKTSAASTRREQSLKEKLNEYFKSAD